MLTQRIQFAPVERVAAHAAFVALPAALFPAMQTANHFSTMIYDIARHQAEQSSRRKTIMERLFCNWN